MSRMLPVVVNPAAMAVWENPLALPKIQEAWPGTPLRDLAPSTLNPLMLRVNGQWLLRAHWWRPVFPGDVIEWHILPQGGGGGASRLLMTVVIAVASIYTGGAVTAALGSAAYGALASAAVSIIGAALMNALVPIQQPGSSNSGQSPNSVYNVSASGNQARLNQPIPVGYGRMLDYPDFAGQPYVEYSDNDQFFYAVYCIGQGSYNFERIQIDDTAINSFQDVAYETLAPGQLPTLALANVSTAPEISGQELKTLQIVGGFAACGPTLKAAAIGIDIVFPRGLGLANGSGDIGNLSASFAVDIREIDDFGVSQGNWTRIGTETVTKASSEVQRFSFKYNIADPVRVEVRLTRTDARNEKITALHDMTWAGLRAYLSATAPLAATATHMAVRLRASEQLNGLSQRKIGVIWRRKLRKWSQGGGWTAEVETRNPMWARLDKLTNPVYGDGLPDSRIDLVTHADLAVIYDSRQDRFDMKFDSKVTSIDADRTICMAGRAAPFQRAGVCTVTRDQLQTLPVTAFTSRDIFPGSMNIGYALATEVTADGVIVEYFNNRAWDWREILCPAPGVEVPVNAVRQRIMGVTGPIHAEREGLYLAAQNMYRRKFPKFQTEMQGFLPAYGSAVLFAPALPGWGQAGDVAFWDSETKTMGLTEPVVFTPGATHFISIRRDDGSVTPAIEVTPGPTSYDVVLESVPMMPDDATPMFLALDDANRERPKFVFGAEGQHRIIVRVLGIRKRGKAQDGTISVEIETVAEDERVHEADNELLPGPGEVQDPVDGTEGGIGGEGGGGEAALALVNLTDKGSVAGTGLWGGGEEAWYELANDGRAYKGTLENGGSAFDEIEEQWARNAPVEVGTAALYEVRATMTGSYVDGINPVTMLGSALDVWLSLGTTRRWTLQGPLFAVLKVEIREVSTGVIMDTATIGLTVNATGDSP